MTDISLVHTGGGLIGDVITDSLRQPDVDGDAKFLTATATFTDLDGAAPTQTQLAADQEAAFRSGVALWSSYADELKKGMDISRIRERLVLKLLELLGFQPVYQRAKLHAGGQSWDISHLGWEAEDAAPIHTTVAVDLDAREGHRRSPHEELQGYLNAAPQRWGMLTNGRVLRLLRDYHHTRTRGYIEFDLAAIFESASWPDFLALWRLCHVSRFQAAAVDTASQTEITVEDDTADADTDNEGGAVAEVNDAATTLLEILYTKAVSAGVAAGRRLQPQVRAAIGLLANGLLDANPALREQLTDNPDLGRDLYRELLTVLYRTLFLLFAEQRAMLKSASALYTETYSLTRLRTVALDGHAEPRRMDLWEGLKTTFRVFSNETDAATLGVYPYNGMLFDQSRTPLTSGCRMANLYLTQAIDALTTVQAGKVRMHVDYRNLGVEELGAVYESLLDYTLTLATDVQSIDGKAVRPGEAYLAPLSMERSDLASYYTPVDLTDLLLTRTLDPLIERTLAAAGDDPIDQVDALLDLRIVDPACGSAAILIGALDRLAYAVARARSAPAEPRDIDVAHARREVLQSCIYGAEKDPFATELAKVALWIHCVVPDQPLTFLDHHIVCGDSLVGWPLLNVPNAIPDEAFKVAGAKGAESAMLTKARRRNEHFTSAGGDLFQSGTVAFTLALPDALQRPERTPADVNAKAIAYQEWMNSPEYALWKQTADLWTSSFFWTTTTSDGSAPPTSVEYAEALDGNPDSDLAKTAAKLLADINPLHWPLAFPEAHASGGFHLVVGNPPWEQFESGEQPFFKQHKPTIAAMTSETRKKAITGLEASDPSLFQRWKLYQSLQGRLAHYAKACGRFTRTSGKVNTYVLFTELAANASRHAGLIVKSGIAIDASQSAVWKKLLDDGRVHEVLDIVNQDRTGRRVFTAVAPVERFSILSLGPRSPRDVRAAMLNFGVNEAATAELRIWTRPELRIVSPRTETLLSSDDPRELDLALKLQSEFNTLDFAESDGVNPWHMRFATLFNSSNSKEAGQLLRRPALEELGFELQRNRWFVHPDGRSALPVYEGQMANRWDHRARTYEGFKGKDRYGRKPHIPWVTDEQHADPRFEVEPRYWMHQQVAMERLNELAQDDSAMIAFREIGRPWTDRRIVRGCLYPSYPATDKLPMLILDRGLAFRFLALFNSMTFDFLARLHMPGGSLKSWIPSQCAAPSAQQVPDLAAAAAAELSLTSESVAKLMGQPVSSWDMGRRELLDAKCDALIARTYGLTTAEYELVLDHFKLLAKIETRTLGEYRSKRLRLEAFEEAGGQF